MSSAAPTEMQVTREELNPCTIQLSVVCSADQVREGFARAYKEAAKQVRVPGFRPGQAPRSVVEKQIPKEQIARVAADEIVRKAFKAALDKEELKPENVPSVNLEKVSEDPPECTFTAKVPLAPKVTLGDYKGIQVERPIAEVTDEDVEGQLDDLRRRGGKREAVLGRGIQEGDYAVVHIKAEGEEGDGRSFMTIAGQTFPGLDEAIMGMSTDEMKSLELSFPENFQEKDWAGKTHKCQLTIRSVNSYNLPELDDEFAKSLNAENLDELKEKLRGWIGQRKAGIAQEMVNDRLLDAVIAASEIHVADTTWESVVSRRMQEIGTELQREKLTFEQYCQRMGMSIDQFKEALTSEAQLHVRRAVIVEQIFRAEELKITDQDAQAQLVQIAIENNVKPEDMRKFAKDHGQEIRDEVLFRAMYAKVTAFLTENANITEAGEQ